MHVTTVPAPPSLYPSGPYVGNRPPLEPQPLLKLPLGAVRPRGWLRHQLELMTTGMTGRLEELSRFLQPDNGWFGGDDHGWEEQPYWLRGFHDLALLTGKEDLRARATRWLEAVLTSQQADGYFGAQRQREVVGKHRGGIVTDLWGHMVMIDARSRRSVDEIA